MISLQSFLIALAIHTINYVLGVTKIQLSHQGLCSSPISVCHLSVCDIGLANCH